MPKKFQMVRVLKIKHKSPLGIKVERSYRMRRSILGWGIKIANRQVFFRRHKHNSKWAAFLPSGIEPVIEKRTISLCIAYMEDLFARRDSKGPYRLLWSCLDQVFYALTPCGGKAFETVNVDEGLRWSAGLRDRHAKKLAAQ